MKLPNRFCQWCDYMPYGGGAIFLLGGAARAEAEVVQFRELANIYKHQVAVLLSPYGVGMGDCQWGVFGIADGPLWQVGVIGSQHLDMLAGQNRTRYAKTLGDSYMDLGLIEVGVERGAIDNQKLQFSAGMEVVITDHRHDRRLSVNSCVGILSLQSVRKPMTRWPLAEGTDGKRREISLTAQCVILGIKRWRNAVLVGEREAVDAIWRSTPKAVWAEIVGKLCDGFEFNAHYLSVEDGDIDADRHGFTSPEGEIHVEADMMYQYWPESVEENHCGESPPEVRAQTKEWAESEDLFRVGKASARRHSQKPSAEECACARRSEHIRKYGLPPISSGNL